jgi:hypothetical protein
MGSLSVLEFAGGMRVRPVAYGAMICKTRRAERSFTVGAKIDVGEAKRVVARSASRLRR